jgi:hypothetical protein
MKHQKDFLQDTYVKKDNLKPCPFCGGAMMLNLDNSDIEWLPVVRPTCLKCGTVYPSISSKLFKEQIIEMVMKKANDEWEKVL